MKVLIDVPDEVYKKIQDSNVDESLMIEPYKWIKNGVPLPKGHGRLIDADYKVSSDGWTVNSVCGYMAPTIIEADRSEEE